MQSVLFDTSIYIAVLRSKEHAALQLRQMAAGVPVWLSAKYDYEQIGRGRLTNDTLIATSAGRLGITVLTANARNLLFGWRVERLASR